MEKLIKSLIAFFIVSLSCVSFTGCNDDDKLKREPNDYEQQFIGETWEFVKLDRDGDYWYAKTPRKFTFTGEILGNGNLGFILAIDGFTTGVNGINFWCIDDEGRIDMCEDQIIYKHYGEEAQDDVVSQLPDLRAKIIKHYPDELILGVLWAHSGDKELFYYKRVPTPSNLWSDDNSSGNNGGDDNYNEGDNSGGSSSGSESGYEEPEIGFDDFTATKNSLTVDFRIYNSDKAGVTSATIKYGTSSPSKSVTATVTGTRVRARISGLKAGTSYYVNCTVRGKGGSATSETVTCITNF